MADFKTPGVYIVEKNAFPPSAVAVPTAVPVFIGYTEKAERKGKDLFYVPTKIASMAEYAELFGGPFRTKFVLSDNASTPADPTEEEFKLGGKTLHIKYKEHNQLLFYNCVRLFYLNGGSECYILSVGKHDTVSQNGISKSDFFSTTNDNKDVMKLLEKEWEPTLVLLPDVVSLLPTATDIGYYEYYQTVLDHCYKVQSRFGIFDVARSSDGTDFDAIGIFRNAITKNLNYGAAYYPWIKTTVVDDSEVDYSNIDDFATVLNAQLTEPKAIEVLVKMKSAMAPASPPASPPLSKEEQKAADDAQRLQFHQSLLACSNTYKQLIAELKARLNLLPPSAAMAGIYKTVDTARGVWKAPANIGVSSVNAPEVNISSLKQELMNVDPVSGKSINVIRTFPGIGTLVWGARTLDGNSQDWRYVNVRRTMIFIEQSLKLATRNFVFEPNDNGTWITIKSMFNGFLYNLWKQGALPGSTPEVAYSIQIGLGVTMTPDDILDGILRVTVLVAIVRPAEFIEITFQQQQQQA
jgi:phage tail sheath protein FI